MKDVTVVIVNWNSGSLLADCLQHLTLQTIRPKKIVVIDNFSSDDSIANIEQFERVEILRMQSNLGFAAANNYVLKHCTTEFIALLNPDAFPAPNWLEKLFLAAEAYPTSASFGSRQVRHENTQLLDGIGDSYHMSGLVWRAGYGAQNLEHCLQPCEIFSPCAAAALYRTKVLQELGGFDEDFFCYVEDIDLGFRLRLAGHKSYYVPEASVRHVGSASTGGSGSDFSVYHGHRNLIYAFIKNMPGALFWLLLPLHLLLNLVTIAVFMRRGQCKLILRAKRDALFGLPQAWRKRQQVQSTRVATLGEIWHVLDKQFLPKRQPPINAAPARVVPRQAPQYSSKMEG
ncbi:glycosyltransferase family 2 protein [Undibacterium sp. Di24W]|uniref:glycosyltransferase family 2 protein n=1 Tax=Undibacterium sp. Di24W TaxID=3413033 RepID=UPI003BF15333